MASNKTLLDIAKNNLTVAKDMLKLYSDDEVMLNIVAYHLQQCVELSLKHYIEMAGERFLMVHDIRKLCDQAAQLGIDFPYNLEQLSLISGTITEMESKTRYVKNSGYSLSVVKQVLEICEVCVSDMACPAVASKVYDFIHSDNPDISIGFICDVLKSMPENTDAAKLVAEVLIRWEMQK